MWYFAEFGSNRNVSSSKEGGKVHEVSPLASLNEMGRCPSLGKYPVVALSFASELGAT